MSRSRRVYLPLSRQMMHMEMLEANGMKHIAHRLTHFTKLTSISEKLYEIRQKSLPVWNCVIYKLLA
jgi:hypothetical protein